MCVVKLKVLYIYIRVIIMFYMYVLYMYIFKQIILVHLIKYAHEFEIH